MGQGKQISMAAVALFSPCAVEDVRFSVKNKTLAPLANFPRGNRFPCPVFAQECTAHDTQAKVRRYLYFSQYMAYLHSECRT